MHQKLLFTAFCGILVLNGCASSMSGGAYERRQARTAQNVEMGVVDHVRVVQIEGTKSGVGAAAGVATGGVAGRQSGNSAVGKAVGGVAGAVVGGIAGAAIEEGVTRQKGYEITVRLDGGRLIAVTQAADEEFKVGDRVRILSGQGVTRVSH